LVLDGDELDVLDQEPPTRTPPSSPDPSAPFAILFTSGTSGTPKGAILTAEAFVASAAASAQNLGWLANDRWIACMPLCHVGGLSILTRCLLARRAVVLHPRFDADSVLESIEARGGSFLSVVPTMLRALLEADRRGTLARLRAVLVGGAAAPPPLLEECQARGLRALATYGLTEACSQVTAQRLADAPSSRGSGPPLPGTSVRIDRGRILVAGPTLMRGYLGQPELPPAAWFDTGDLGELDDRGHLLVHARRTDLVVTGGENVYPAEVEAALESCPGVHRAAVFGVPDDRWGEIVAAAIEPGPGGAPTLEALAAALVPLLAPFKRPRRVCFVPRLPAVGPDKPDRARARALFTPELRPFP
jgi:O-succinylbenzoic acid--CoA ligase